jgi:hypothetical protein
MGVVGMIFGALVTWPAPVNPVPERGDHGASEDE